MTNKKYSIFLGLPGTVNDNIFCSLVWVYLDLLVVFFPGFADVSSEIHDLVGKNDTYDVNILLIKSNWGKSEE